MILVVALLMKALAAELADERLVPVVDSHVGVQGRTSRNQVNDTTINSNV